MKNIIIFIIILSAVHAFQSMSKRSALEEKKHQPQKNIEPRNNQKK